MEGKSIAGIVSLFLFLGVATLVCSTPAQLFQAVKGNDPAAVKSLLDHGENVKVKADDLDQGISDATPLYYAVVNKNAAIVKMLIEAGSDVNATPIIEGPGARGYADSLLVFAAAAEQWDIVDLLAKAGARQESLADYLRVALEKAVGGNAQSLIKAERLIGHVNASQVPMLYWLLQYESSSPDWRKFILKNVPEIAEGKVTLLDALLTIGEKNVALFGTNGKIPLPLATSSLQDARKPGRYGPDKALDGDAKTSWAEGASGDGIGEKIAFQLPGSAKSIAVIPGYGEEKYFSTNNRVKSAVFSIYVIGIDPYENAYGYSSRKLSEQELSFRDEMVFQKAQLRGPKVELAYGEFLLGVFEIRSVYPGTTDQDTCVAEIKIE